jgi:peroxiredoxin
MLLLFRTIRMILILFALASGIQAQQNTIADFTAATISGEQVSFSDYLKKGPVYVSFWATWCEPCKAELKMLKPLAETFRDRGLSILAINTDDPKTSARVKAYVRSQRFSFPVLLDPDGRIFQQLNGSAVPYSLLIARDGTVLYRRTGYLPGDEKLIEEKFEQALAGTAK